MTPELVVADSIDVITFARGISARKRGRACAIMTYEYTEQRDWAAKLARLTDLEHVDVLELFYEDEQLGNNLYFYSPEGLFSLLQDRLKQGNTAIVSGIEFLKASWSGQKNSAEEFAACLEMWQGNPALLFVMQYDKAIAEHPFRRFRQHTFIIDQRETIAL